MRDIPEHIFRENDIRGKEGEDLDENSFYFLGLAYGNYLYDKGVFKSIVARDNRKMSPDYSEAAIRGLENAGISVINIGMVSTPMAYWAQFFYKVDGGMMVTASHNPTNWNGAKLSSGKASILGGADLKKLRDMIVNNSYSERKGGMTRKENIKDDYFKDIAGRVSLGKKLKILVNTGNGTLGAFAPDLFRALGAEVLEENVDTSVYAQKYNPDPLNPEMIKDTERKVLETGSDMAFMFDGDGDRVGMADEKGCYVYPDIFYICLLRALKKEKGEISVLSDVMSSKSVMDEAKKMGARFTISETGHKKIKDRIKKEDIDIAGEASGHIIFQYGYYGFDDGLFAAVKLLEYFSKQEFSVSRVIQTIPQYISSPIQYIEVPEEKKFEIVKNISQDMRDDGYEIKEIDGVLFYLNDGRGVIRSSNTNPAIAVRFESKTQDGFVEIRDIIYSYISKHTDIKEL